MTATATSPRFEVDDLDAATVLSRVADAEMAERRAALEKLELALQWCVLHPATAETGTAVWGDAGLPGLSECDETLGGDGCPSVAAFAPEPFAAALGVSTSTGMQVLADALDLAHRLPATWARVQVLEVPAWKARRLAQATHHLTQTAAGRVDARLAPRLDSCGPVAIDREVAQATAMEDPGEHADAEELAKDTWDVKLFHPTGVGSTGFAGTSHLQATGDSADLQAFYDAVCDHAHQLGLLGDTDPLGARKAKALGLIADAQSQLDLYGHPNGEQPVSADTLPVPRPSLTKTQLYLHLGLADLIAYADHGVLATGVAERLGPATVEKIRQWLAGTHTTIVPVLDLARDDAVDAHDPPEWMRESVLLRDGRCVFPWCTRDARACDLDHITPYVPVDEGGPPGQTRPTGLAPLCRRHHRAKTSRRWRYHRDRDGTYTWHGPHHTTYRVTSRGTTALTRP